MAVKVNLPDYTLDPLFQKSQDVLFPLGTALATGEGIPDYYKTIGAIGGEEFEDVLGLAKRDVTRAGLETAARMKIRGPRAAFGIGQNIADLTKKLRFEDLMAGKEGRKFLLGTGLETVSDVRGGALSETGLRSEFDLSRAGLDIGMQEFNEEMAFRREQQEAKEKAARNKMWSDLFGSVVGAGANIYGMKQLTDVLKLGSAGGNERSPGVGPNLRFA